MVRYTTPTTPQELSTTINTIIHRNRYAVQDVEGLLIVVDTCKGVNMLAADLSAFNYENATTETTIDQNHPLYPYIGLTQFGHVTVYGTLLSTDYGTPYYAVLYRDDKQRLRGYIPRQGNAINPITNELFGDGGIHDDRIAQFLGYADYRSMPHGTPATDAQFYDINRLTNDIVTHIQLKP